MRFKQILEVSKYIGLKKGFLLYINLNAISNAMGCWALYCILGCRNKDIYIYIYMYICQVEYEYQSKCVANHRFIDNNLNVDDKITFNWNMNDLHVTWGTEF